MTAIPRATAIAAGAAAILIAALTTPADVCSVCCVAAESPSRGGGGKCRIESVAVIRLRDGCESVIVARVSDGFDSVMRSLLFVSVTPLGDSENVLSLGVMIREIEGPALSVNVVESADLSFVPVRSDCVAVSCERDGVTISVFDSVVEFPRSFDSELVGDFILSVWLHVVELCSSDSVAVAIVLEIV